MSAQLHEPILDGGVFDVAFFNGRVLSAEDMRADQAARRQIDARLGRAIGAGVVCGFDVAIAPVDASTALVQDGRDGREAALAISPGLAIAPQGRTLEVTAPIELSLARPTFTASDSGFSDCHNDRLQATHTGVGLYLVTVSHATDFRERVPMVGLAAGDRITGCGSRYEVQGVAFRLVKLALDELGAGTTTSGELRALVDATNEQHTDAPVAELTLLRNRVAHACFGTGLLPRLHTDPFALVTGQPAWPDELGALASLSTLGRIGAEEVPLAILYWTRRGIGFVDMWSVRRRPSVNVEGQPWAVSLNERRLRVAEAVCLQFQDQLATLQTTLTTPADVAAVSAQDHFRYVPPVGLLPKPFGGRRGFDADIFFGDLSPGEVAMTDGNLLMSLLRDALSHEPVDLAAPPVGFRRYDIWDNDEATLFASFTLPRIFGVGRLDTARWDWNRFA